MTEILEYPLPPLPRGTYSGKIQEIYEPFKSQYHPEYTITLVLEVQDRIGYTWLSGNPNTVTAIWYNRLNYVGKEVKIAVRINCRPDRPDEQYNSFHIL